tara:strand:- start:3202 stop:3348 length:147 start_codon:yes stop_codon:yes gene_type:complete
MTDITHKEIIKILNEVNDLLDMSNGAKPSVKKITIAKVKTIRLIEKLK